LCLKRIGMLGLRLKFLCVLTLFAFVILSMIPFRYQLIDGSLTSSTNKSDDSNATASLTSSSDNNQTKPNSTMAITKSFQNNSKQDSAFSSSTPVQNTSNVVISNPDREEQQLLSSSSPTTQQQLSEGTQLPLLPTFSQPIQEPQVFSPPIYPLEPSVIQSELLFQGEPFTPAYPQAPSLIQSLQNLQPLTPAYPQEPSLIQSQLLLQNVLLEPILQPLYSYPVNTLTMLPVLLPETIHPIQIPPRILSYSDYVSSTGSLHIVGEVINESFQPIRFVEITATFYDSNNRVIGTDFTFANPSTLQPGQRAPFDMIIIEGSIPTYLMAYYILSVDYSDFGLLR
jgi:hypothetical protein